MAKTRKLRLLRERKLADLIAPPRDRGGVRGEWRDCRRRPLLCGTRQRPPGPANRICSCGSGSGEHQWVGRARQGEGYEAISHGGGRFLLMIEAMKHPDGTFKGAIEEYDEALALQGPPMGGLSIREAQYGLRGSRLGRVPGRAIPARAVRGQRLPRRTEKQETGRGRIQVLQRRGQMWHPVEQIKLPQACEVQGLRRSRVSKRTGSPSSRRNRRVCGSAASARELDDYRIRAGLRLSADEERQEAVLHRRRDLVGVSADTRCGLRSTQEAVSQA